MSSPLLYNVHRMSGQPGGAKLPISRHAYSPKVVDLDFPSYLRKDDAIQDVVQHLRISGACVVRRMFSQRTMNAIEEEIRPYIQAAHDEHVTHEDIVPAPTTTITTTATITAVPNLQDKSRTHTSSVAENMLWQGVCEYFLATQSPTPQQKDNPHTIQITTYSNSTAAAAAALSIQPGTQAQPFHRNTHLSLSIEGTPDANQHGTTRILPGSHLWHHAMLPSCSPDQFQRVDMTSGDALFMLPGVYYGLGANPAVNGHRLVCLCYATGGDVGPTGE